MMKRFVVKLSILLIIVVVADYCVGIIMDFMRNNAHGGQTYQTEYITHHCNEDILVMGSSRASHHYVPQIIENETGLSCYNCGYDGQGIIFHYALLQMILERYTPKFIILEVSPPFDINFSDNSRYIKLLRPYAYNNNVKDVIIDVDKSEALKLYSNLYRYNTYFLTIGFDYFRREKLSEDGFIPNYDKLTVTPEKNPDFVDLHPQDSLKLAYLEKFVLCCKNSNIEVIASISPMFTDDSMNDVLEPAVKILNKYNVPIVNYSCDAGFNFNLSYFSDNCHLTVKGAELYTSKFCSEQFDLSVLEKEWNNSNPLPSQK